MRIPLSNSLNTHENSGESGTSHKSSHCRTAWGIGAAPTQTPPWGQGQTQARPGCQPAPVGLDQRRSWPGRAIEGWRAALLQGHWGWDGHLKGTEKGSWTTGSGAERPLEGTGRDNEAIKCPQGPDKHEAEILCRTIVKPLHMNLSKF